MEKLNKKLIRISSLTGLAVLYVHAVFFIFMPQIRRVERDLDDHKTILKEYRELLTRKSELESQWEEKKGFLSPAIRPDEALNSWLKDLLTYAQSQNFAVEKLEPSGSAGEKIRVFISFQSDIHKFIEFVYHLAESDPLAKIESLLIRQENGEKTLSFQLMLGKAIQ